MKILGSVVISYSKNRSAEIERIFLETLPDRATGQLVHVPRSPYKTAVEKLGFLARRPNRKCTGKLDYSIRLAGMTHSCCGQLTLTLIEILGWDANGPPFVIVDEPRMVTDDLELFRGSMGGNKLESKSGTELC